MTGNLEGKVVAITGAGRGIGRELALHCAAQGAAVVVNDPGFAQEGGGGDAAPAEATAAEITAAGGMAAANFANVADPKEAAAIIEDAVAKFGRIDAVVNNAGMGDNMSKRCATCRTEVGSMPVAGSESQKPG